VRAAAGWHEHSGLSRVNSGGPTEARWYPPSDFPARDSILLMHFRLGCSSPNDPSSRLHREENARKGGAAAGGLQSQAIRPDNGNLSGSQSMTDLDSLMPYEQSYQHSANSNFIPLDPREKVTSFATAQAPNYTSDLRNAEKWFMTDLSLGW
jgi:hypothetical protein